MIAYGLERFSLSESNWFPLTTRKAWLKRKKTRAIFHAISCKAKINRDLFTHAFPRFASAICNIRGLTGSMDCLYPLGLVRLITLVLVLHQHSTENRSNRR